MIEQKWCEKCGKDSSDCVCVDGDLSCTPQTAGSKDLLGLPVSVGVEMLRCKFEENIIRETDGTFYTIKCKKGLWRAHGSVSGAVAVENQARHYFVKYLEKGEYTPANDIVSGGALND